MTDNNLDVRARLTAVNELSPVLRRVLNDIQKFEGVAKRVNVQLSGMGRAGMSAFDGFNRSAKAATDQLRGMTNLARSAARDYAADWSRANTQRLNEARRTHAALERLEVGHQRQLARRAALESRAGALDRGRPGRGSLPRGTSPTTALIAGGISFSAAASAFKRRMEVNVAETKAQLFGGLSPAEVKKLRGDWSDQIAIKFGESASVVIDSFTESLKQGFGQDAAKRITEGAMESAAALELNIADLMKLAGKTATGLYGNVKNADPASVVKMMNSVAVAAAATAADPDEVIEANKRALSALSTTKMRETDLSAFTSVGISAGLQANKAGTALSYLTSEIANAGNARGQRATDLNQASQMLGYGTRQQMAQRMASAPTEFMLDMFTKMQSMSEQNRAKFANLAGMREWRDELVQMAKAADQIRETLKEIDLKGDSVSAFSATKLKSLQKRWDRIKVMFSLAWERLGSGIENTFVEISNWFDKHSSLFTSGRIAEKSREFVEKLKKAFGIGSTDEALSKIVEKLSSIDVDRIIGFASGFVGGLVSVANSMTAMLKSAANIMGRDGNDAEVLGKLSGQIVGLSVALGLLAPVLTVLAGFAGLISRIAGSLGGRALIGAGARLGLGPVLGPAVGLALGNEIGVADSAIKRPGETTTQWRERQRKLRELRNYQTPSDADPLFQPSSYTGSTDFSGRRRSKIDDLAEQLNKFGANVQRAAFINSAPGSGLQYAALGGAGRGLSGSVRSGGGLGSGLIGNVPDMLRSKPGSLFSPDANLGSIIRRDKIPSFGGTGGSGELSRSGFDKVFRGTPLAGKYEQIVAAAKANGVPPSLLASVMAQETGRGKFLSGNNPGGIMDPATGWSKKMRFADLDAGIAKTGSVLGKNYAKAGGDLSKLADRYARNGAANDPGGLNKNWLPGVNSFMGQMGGGNGGGSAGTGDALGWASKFKGMNEYTDTKMLAAALGGDVRGKSNAWCARFVNKALESAGGKGTGSAVANSFQRWGSAVDPSSVSRNDVLLQTGGKSYMQTGGHVGLATGETRMNNGRVQVKMLAGNDNDSVREHWIDADKNLMVRRGNSGVGVNVPQGITSQVPPASAIQNVPTRSSVTPGVGAGDIRSSGGPVAIHINGNSHDPEALATLVQRRIDESMNWRTHDTASEYT
ncbi:phage tail tape measure protein [Bradyrhizobium sp. NBAIM14]|uniref:phage tail tape measure protein n=1 Tax=Bradyrhizobium sp. NBAIM14 TaxID=2793814 RepID=UPI001CD78E1A|nr:phage tail tape measure protein [Bradyrhizobium sp. NBAIM14]MCA1498093.1 phage tail tape measure protein [Bradyrhizobium sp. NBAIM14]